MKLIVGLGNPGENYKLTRHNIGFLAVERIAEENGIKFSRDRSYSLIGMGAIVDQKVSIAKPLTYMNLCGKAVKDLLDYFKVDADSLIIIHDDIDMEFGKIKIKEKGGHGGHNGVRSIISTLGTKDFVRIKIGIGRPLNKQGVKDYVLSPFDLEQQDFLPRLIDLAEKATISIITLGRQITMNEFNQ